jgi:hypothetical protein
MMRNARDDAKKRGHNDSFYATGPVCNPDSTYQDVVTYAASQYLLEQADLITAVPLRT